MSTVDKVRRPCILLSNDDGYTARGLQTLAGVLRELGDLYVSAPVHPHSGMSQAITIIKPLRYREIPHSGGYPLYGVEGTPTDCVKLALNTLLPRFPDLVVAGINHGSNASINVLYSGTMGAVLEGCLSGIPSIGFSLSGGKDDSDFTRFIPYCRKIVEQVLAHGLPGGVCLNVNLPRHPIKGVRLCREAKGRFENGYEKRTDPRGHDYYWLKESFRALEDPSEGEGNDDRALHAGYIAVVPIRTDMTDYEQLKEMERWSLEP